ncbi:hypothetical protein QBC40DRAFT_293744 [Triangularia verruculosa]|uniref:1-alkyl-2-acetylglycerophosphocholine esterase n=1 Tax=Triangularia verruculosa TaxID=2587418 RepID=A0AAN6XS75_9PEZI|nr:hypothetical protein QBC40DRAFT_293744 [Triangularia verruculosa]
MQLLKGLTATLYFSRYVHGVLIPVPDTPYLVKWTSSELVNDGVPDPFNPSHTRRIMISRYTPVRKRDCLETCRLPYMNEFIASAEDDILQAYVGDAVWPRGILSSLEVEMCCKERRGSGGRHPGELPLLLFGTGLNTTRLWYSSMAQNLAGMGFEVIVMDHPYETDVVQFPDGTVIYGGRVPADVNAVEELTFALEVRAKDASLVLDRLRVPKSAKVGFVGSSFGGPAAATAMLRDSRIAAGVNFDGAMFGAGIEAGAARPFLLFGAAGHNTSSEDTWGRFWNATAARRPVPWMKELSVLNSSHGTYTDYPIIGEITGLNESKELSGLGFGPVSGVWVMEMMREYLSDFFRFTLKGAGEGLLAGPSDKYPEVKFLRSQGTRPRF